MAPLPHPAEHDLLAYAWDLAEPDERAAVAAHLAGCPACRRAARAWRELAGTLWHLAACPPPRGLRERVLAAPAAPAGPAARPERRTGGVRRGAAAACAALLLVTAGWWALRAGRAELARLRLERDSLGEQLRAAAASLRGATALPMRRAAAPAGVEAWVELGSGTAPVVLVRTRGLPRPPRGFVYAVSLRRAGEPGWRVEGLLVPDAGGQAVWLYAAVGAPATGVRVSLERADRAAEAAGHAAPAGPVWLEAALAGP